MAQLAGHVAFDLKLCGSIPVYSEAIVRFHSHTPNRHAWSCLVCKEGKVGCPPTSSVPPSEAVRDSPNAVAKMITFRKQWLGMHLC